MHNNLSLYLSQWKALRIDLHTFPLKLTVYGTTLHKAGCTDKSGSRMKLPTLADVSDNCSCLPLPLLGSMGRTLDACHELHDLWQLTVAAHQLDRDDVEDTRTAARYLDRPPAGLDVCSRLTPWAAAQGVRRLALQRRHRTWARNHRPEMLNAIYGSRAGVTIVNQHLVRLKEYLDTFTTGATAHRLEQLYPERIVVAGQLEFNHLSASRLIQSHASVNGFTDDQVQSAVTLLKNPELSVLDALAIIKDLEA